jgi:hypothetical protein
MRHVFITRKWPERYFTGLSPVLKRLREKELMKRRRGSYALGATNRGGTSKKSRWTALFHKTYPNLKFNKSAIARETGISRSTLNTVYNRGLKAWQTSGSRVGANPAQWATARVYKYVLVTKKKAPKAWYITRADPDQDLRKK